MRHPAITIELYEKPLSREIAIKDVSTHLNKLNAFCEYHHLTNDKLSSITAVQITDYLDYESEDYNEPNRRFNRTWKYFSRFFNYASRTWEIDNVAARVKKRKNEQRGDIHWHTADEILQTIAPLDNYWKALVGTLGFAGCSAHEMRGLKLQDFYENKGEYFLRVQPNEIRTLKNTKRSRSVHVHKKYLLPLLQEHIKSLSGDLLFPSRVAGSPYWLPSTLSIHLNGKKAQRAAKAIIGVLPLDMSALSLRRAYGSNMLRSGKTASEVAAAMGNSSRMVEDHYARLLGKEIKADY